MSTSNRLGRAVAGVAERLVAAYRQTGADIPFGDPLPSHGCEMEGWFWRITDSASGRVVVALCSVNRHPDGDWATVAVALHPGGMVRAAALDAAQAERYRFAVSAGTAPPAAVAASVDRLLVELDDVHLELRFADPYVWPKALAGGGLFSSIPFLNQYWHPYRTVPPPEAEVDGGQELLRQGIRRSTRRRRSRAAAACPEGEKPRPGHRYFKPFRQVIESINNTHQRPNSTLNATAGAPSRASHREYCNASSPSPPRSGTTTNSASHVAIATARSLGGTATGTVEFNGGHWSFDAAPLYAERNWGAGFPERWWWGQAHDFGGADVSVAFSGGLLRLGPIRRDVAGVVVRLGERAIRVTPPASVRSRVGEGRWTVRAKSPRYQIELDGDDAGLKPHILPVPLPAERRNVDTDFEHLAGRLHCVVREFGRVIFDGRSELTGLEVGSLPNRS